MGKPKHKEPSMAEKCKAVHRDIIAYNARQIQNRDLRRKFIEVAKQRTSLKSLDNFRIPQRGGFVTLGEQRTLIIHDPRTGKGRIGRANILLPESVINDFYRAREAARRGETMRVSDRTVELAAHEGMHLRSKIGGVPEREVAYLKSTYAVDHKQMMRDLGIVFGDELAKNYAKYWPTGVIAEAVGRVAEEKVADEAAIMALIKKRVMETGKPISRNELKGIQENVIIGRPSPIQRAVKADFRMVAARGRGARFKPKRTGPVEELAARLDKFAEEAVAGLGHAEGLFHPAAPFVGGRKDFSSPGRRRRAA